VADQMLTLGFDAKVDYIMVLKEGISLDHVIQVRGRSLRKHDDDNKVAALIIKRALLNNLAKDTNIIDIEKRIRYSQEHRLSKQGLHNAFRSSKENKDWLTTYMEKTYGKSGLKIKRTLDNFYLIATGRSTVGGFSLAHHKSDVISMFYGFADGVIDHLHEKIMSEQKTTQNYQDLFDEFIAAQH
jgi:superfamily II DNA or RNA helicase